ncbi:MAG: acetyltransferase [Candidatus Competibacter sp.]|nr:acetyltransferase [Candidatus Competibacter sp.]MDG4606691.1 acetyltransferase [Candidatus Contendobacter sp.]
MTDAQTLAEAVRAACIKAALDAYEEGGVLGLCAEGRWEYAISAMRQLELDTLIQDVAGANHTGRQLLV